MPVDYDYGFESPQAVPPRPLRADYDIFHANLRPAHRGNDLYSPAGSAIVAAAAGTVRYAGLGSSAAGWLVEILHPGPVDRGNSPMSWYLTRYMHMAIPPVVTAGQEVGKGIPLGIVGATGNANSPHNHFEIRYADNADADQWTVYGSMWGTPHDPQLFVDYFESDQPSPLVRVTVDRPQLRNEGPPYSEELAVAELQTLLDLRGFTLGDIDGKFGLRTEQAVRDFQIVKGVTADGIVGPITWTLLLDY